MPAQDDEAMSTKNVQDVRDYSVLLLLYIYRRSFNFSSPAASSYSGMIHPDFCCCAMLLSVTPGIAGGKGTVGTVRRERIVGCRVATIAGTL